MSMRTSEFDWRPCLEALGTFDELTSDIYVDFTVLMCSRTRTNTRASMAFETGPPPVGADLDEVAHFSDPEGDWDSVLQAMPFGVAFMPAHVAIMEEPPRHWGVIPVEFRQPDNWEREE